MSSTNRFVRWAGAAAALLIGACGMTPPAPLQARGLREASFASDGESLDEHYAIMEREGARNEVLNAMELGLCRFAEGDDAEAARLFDRAIARIETFYIDDPNANLVRTSLSAEEGLKDFKGEPYERAMLYYYRGLVYLAQGRPSNARAAFRAGALHDAIAEEDQFRCDFALLYFMQAIASTSMADTERAAEGWGLVQRLRPDCRIPDGNAWTLVLVESGGAPVKMVDGVEGQRLTVHRNLDVNHPKLRVLASSTPLELSAIEDVFVQASTRGGRPIDSFLDGKARYKATAEETSGALADLGSVVQYATLGTESGGSVGAALGLAGGLRLLTASGVRARADDRAWRNLPELVQFATVTPSRNSELLRVQRSEEDSTERELPQCKRAIELPGGIRLVWIRTPGVHLEPSAR